MQSSHYCTSLAYWGWVSSSSYYRPSLVNATPRYLNFSSCFRVAPFTCNTHWSGFLERWSTSVLAVLIFIPAVLHASAKLFNARWRPDSVEESWTKVFDKCLERKCREIVESKWKMIRAIFVLVAAPLIRSSLWSKRISEKSWEYDGKDLLACFVDL